MARVLLIHVPVGFEEAYPLALAALAAPLLQRGHSVEGLDVARTGLAGLSRRLQRGDVDVAALSVWSPGLAAAEATIQQLRTSRARVVLGGPHPTLRPDALDADVVVQGEGEAAIVEAVESAAPPRVIPRGPPLDLGALPLPDRRVFAVADYHRDHNPRGRVYTPSVTSRGCLYSCAYCSAPDLWGRGHRFRPAEQVVDEWQRLRADHGVAAVLVEDDLFTQDTGRVTALCEALLTAPGPLPAFELINGVRPETLSAPGLPDLLARAGCSRVALSLESHLPERLGAMGRGRDLPRVARVVAALRSAGIGVTGYFLVGLPGETARDRAALFAYAADLGLDMAHFSLASAWPGTHWEAPPVAVSPSERARLYARWYLHPMRAQRAARLLGATPRDLPRMARRLVDWMARPLEARRARLDEPSS